MLRNDHGDRRRQWGRFCLCPLARRLTLLLAFIVLGAAASAATIRLDELDLSQMTVGMGKPHFGKAKQGQSFIGKPLRIAGKTYEHGVGTHAASSLRIDLGGATQRFSAFIGVDDQTTKPGTVEFSAWADGKRIWTSGPVKGGEPARPVELDLAGKQVLLLLAGDGGDGMDNDHADWAEARFAYTGKAPAANVPREEAVILTPPVSPMPRINSARVFGVRPGSPFLYTIAATGERTMTFSASGLPKGLKLNAVTGRITGKLNNAGEHKVTLTAKNALGEASRELRIVVGDKIALTPPMGWNSWNCWGDQVSQEKVVSSARAMVARGLINHGWTYINIDDGWQATRGGKFNAIQPNRKFHDMENLAETIHGMGLKIGIYSTPWCGSYAGYIGSYGDNEDGAYDYIKEGRHDENYKNLNPPENRNKRHAKYSFVKNDVVQWADWGFDYLKYDWRPNDMPHVREMSEALRASGRDFVYSLSNWAPFDHASELTELATVWRTTNDIYDNWGSMAAIGFNQDKWAPFGGPGHWNDPDMLVVGRVGWGNPHPSRLTPNEQYTHISLWCLLSAPLLIGCDMAQLDDFTLSLLTNDEVLAVDQDPLGMQGRQVKRDEFTQVWAKPLVDGSLAVGLFNLGEWEAPVSVLWSDLKIEGERTVRDLWRQKDIGKANDKFEARIPRHGAMLARLSK